MKKILLILYVIIPYIVNASTYYVSTTGNDSNTGTITSPWLTWHKGFNSLIAGDSLIIRGGIYQSSGMNSGNPYFGYCGVYVSGHHGTSVNLITVTNYPGETPVLDMILSNQAAYSHTGICLNNCNYWLVKGLEIKNAKQFSGHGAFGCWFENVNHCKFERLVSHDNGGSGILIHWNSEDNLILNCDGYNNVDPFTGGDNSDGIEVSFIKYREGNPRINTIRGCRAWHNSDDGYDHYSYDGVLIIDSCWAWGNGAYMGIGNGFKLGKTNNTEYNDLGIVQRIVTNCIAAYQDIHGFTNNDYVNDGAHGVTMHIFNNIAYKNGWDGFEWTFNWAPYILRNNISYANTRFPVSPIMYGTNYSVDHNSWNGFTVNDADFTALDTTEFYKPRKANGSLPDLISFHLKPTSDMINGGVNVGLPYYGSAPDIGVFEYIPPAEVKLSSSPSGIMVYPNPMSEELTIECDVNNGLINFEIFNSGGLSVIKGNIAQKTVISTKNLASGIYIIKLENGKSFELKKIIKL